MIARPLLTAPLAALAIALLITPEAAAASAAVKRLRAVAGQLARVDGFVAPDDARLGELDQAVTAVGEQNDEEAAKTLAGLMFTPCKSPSVEVHLADVCRDALAGMSDGAAHAAVRKMLKKGKKNPAIAMALAPVVGAWAEPASAEALAELLGSKDGPVVIAAARGLGSLRLKEGLEALIGAFAAWEGDGGEPLDAIGGALYDITGLGLKTAADWQKWWQDAGAEWDPSQRGKGVGATGERPKNFQSDPPPNMFESMEVRSRRVVLILDVSGSMHIRQYIEEPGERGGEGTGTSLAGGPLPPGLDPKKPGYEPKKCTYHQCPGAKGTGPECPSDENLPDYYSRLARLSRQVQKLVRGFSPKVRFNIVAYSSDARAWKGKDLVPASAGNKEKAVKWIQGLQHGGATSADKALEVAFGFEEADTFVFVTDGAPTNASGRPYPAERWRELLDQVKALNKVRQVKIDVVAIAEGHTDFSTGLASENEGRYVVVD